MKFYRFELAFDGTPQGVGFLQGVDDIGLSNKKFTALMDPFDELPCPRLTDFESRVLFFFTEEGLKKFAPAIDAISKAIGPRGWSLLGLVLDECSFEHSLYHDALQAAWPYEYLAPIMGFYEVKSATDLFDKTATL